MASPAADVLMSEAKDAEAPHQRESTLYRPLHGKFKVKSSDYSRQFCHLYAKRLLEMKRVVQARLATHTDNYADGVQLEENIIKTKSDGSSCYIIGTLYKEMKNKPCVLDELDMDAAAVPAVERYTDDDDYLVLEDETGRIQLLPGDDAAALDVAHFVTGVVVTVRCTVTVKGDVVEELVPCGMAPMARGAVTASTDVESRPVAEGGEQVRADGLGAPIGQPP